MSRAPSSQIQTCYNCSAPFDVLEAGWCSCIARVRSLCCPACLECFCQAPRSYKQRFWLSAPSRLWTRRAAEHQVPDASIRNLDPLALAHPLVLIAESEPLVRKFAAAAVDALGYGVVLARRGDEALELVPLYRPDLVLARALLPKMDGRALCRALKDDPSSAKLPVAIMTPLYTAPRYRYEAVRDFGVDDYLIMPIPFATLRTILEKRLAGVRRTRSGVADGDEDR